MLTSASVHLVYKAFLFLHVLAAVFAVGPLVHAATTAARGLRTGDASAISTAARTTRIYALASTVVVVLGFGLMSMDRPYGGKGGAMGEPWIWISALLWLAAVGLALLVLVPALERAATAPGSGEDASAERAKVAATGGVIGLVFAAIVCLMVYQPGH